MLYKLRTAQKKDETALHAMLPRLADFELPNNRQSEDLWIGDAKLLIKTLEGVVENSHIIVAVDDNDAAVGVALYTIKSELLSGSPSVHLEALAVHEHHSRKGLGKKLIAATEAEAKKKGATCFSLHVFSNNTRARALYKACGFDEELIRCYKPLD